MAIKSSGGSSSHHYDGDDIDSAGGIVAEINITPLTDIFLVLLIVFMVTSSVMSQMGVDVKLPQASAQTAQTQPDGVIVTLLPSGGLKVNQQEVKLGQPDAFEGALKAAFTKSKGKLVVLEGDRQAFLGSAIEVMDRARKAGAEQFAIATSTPNK
jgi:biopolymer transport protein ExbD